MNILIACEESQRVCIAFRDRGHNAFSCDLLDCSGGHPEWHIKGDVLSILNPQTYNPPQKSIRFTTCNGENHEILGGWDMIIAHPPCTYLTNGGAVRMFRREYREYKPYGTFQMVNVDRLRQGMIAKDFFMAVLNADCPRIVIENPVPMSIYMLPEPSQILQPYEFGEPFSKKTCLWCKGVDPLKPTEILTEYQPFINGGGGRMSRPNYEGRKFANGSSERSKTFLGVAKAMATQWG